ncbi:MAG: hypothetical protein K8R88_00615, partial [Armatimonadetes bacterium]|nr:hypothetical protein [Armatimonadota bacterium]
MKRNLLLAAMLVLPMGASAMSIVNRAETFAYNPAHDVQQHVFSTLGSWDAAGRTSHVQAYSESHPFDPPSNKAESWGTFNQFTTSGADANYHCYTGVVGEYNAVANLAYDATSALEISQALEFRTPVNAIIYAVVAAHGLFTAQGNTGINALARASIDIQAYDGIHNRFYTGGLSVTGNSTGGLAPTLSTSGAW